MHIDWITWGVWTFGLALLLYWCFETGHEFQQLFARRKRSATESNTKTDHMDDYTIREILSQPEIWQRTLDTLRIENGLLQRINSQITDGPVIFVGCGSSYYLSLAVAPVWSHFTRRTARAVSASEVMMYPEAHFDGHAKGTVFAVSRSGETPETCWVIRHLRQSHNWRAVGLTCYEGALLVADCDDAIVLPEAAEVSRFTTRALTAMALAVEILVARRTQKIEFERELLQLPNVAERLLARYGGLIQDLANNNFSQYVFLGQGPYFGLASELMLKTKEMARTPAEAYPSLEFLHGPKYAADPSTLITVLLSDGGRDHQLEMLPKLKSLGAKIATICERATPEVTANADFVVELESGLSDYGRMLLVMPLLQLFAYRRALALGKSEWIKEMVRLRGTTPQRS